MNMHQHIINHVRRHKERIVAHVQKHHTKYLAGAGILSGMAIYKIIGMIAIFFGMTYMGGGSIGADYYDTEYYAQQEKNEIRIREETHTESISNTTGCLSINGSTGGSGNCIDTNK